MYSATKTKIDAEKIAECIARKGLKIDYVTSQVGVSNRAFYQWLNGKTQMPYRKNIYRLAEVLEVDYESIAVGD